MSNKKPAVSVFLTSFNHGMYIRQAIESVLKQTFVDFELIIWDDASTDDSWEVIQSYIDPRILAFRNSRNEGPCFGLNKAIFEVSRGRYVAIHHSDDLWELTKLQKQVDFLESNPEHGAVFTWTGVIGDDGSPLEHDWFIKDNKTRWEWLNSIFFMKNPFAHPSVLIRKELYNAIGGYRDYLLQTADVEMWSRVLFACPVEVIAEKLTFHRQFNDGSNTSGSRPDVWIRTWNEWNVLRENFLQISDFETLVAIFPELGCYKNSEGFEIKFLLAMVCLHGSEQPNSWQLGLRWLLELFGDEKKVDRLARLYSFSIKDLYKLMGDFDIYRLLYAHDSYLIELRSGKDWLESQWKAGQAELLAKESYLVEVLEGKAWLESQWKAGQAELLVKDAHLAEVLKREAYLTGQLYEQSVRLEGLRSNSIVSGLIKIGAISDV